MKADQPKGLVSLLRVVLLAGAILYLVLFLALALLRLPYPFELEWMEGGAVDHVRRILAGRPLYVRPSLEFTPYIYTPLYFYLAAGLSRLIGVGFTPLRLLSLGASLGCLLVIFLLVRRETRSAWAGLLAAGAFAATYRLGGAWLDIARVDTLFLFLLLAAIYLLRFGRSWRAELLAGLLITLSFLTKQTALMISAFLILYALLVHWRRGLVVLATVAIGVGASTLVLDLIHGGWYVYYIFDLPGQHALVAQELIGFWVRDILFPLPLACTVIALYLFNRLRLYKERDTLFYPLLVAGMIASAWFSRLHKGGYNNVLLPAYLAIAITFALGIQHLLGRLKAEGREQRLRLYLYVACLVQLAALIYNPAAQVPTAQDLEAGQSFLRTVQQIPGDVYIPYHGYLPTLAGKRTYAQWMALADVLRGEENSIRAGLQEELVAALRQQRFAAIIVDIPEWFEEDLPRYYTRGEPIFASDAVFWPVTGRHVRPELLYVPRVKNESE